MIPVCWHEGIHGVYSGEGVHGRSRYACTGLLNRMFDRYDCEHFSGFGSLPRNTRGCVMIIHGGHERDQLDQINRDAETLDWVLFVGIGDEDNDFPYHFLRHRNSKLWMQSPVPGKSKADRFPIVGYPCDFYEYGSAAKSFQEKRPLDWSFAGQVTHICREDCVSQLRKMQNGKLLETQQFYSGMPHGEYFNLLRQSKIIPCPSGPVCSDTFRLAEALNSGCIPIVDQSPGWKGERTGFWNMVFPQGMPFPLVNNWNQLSEVMDGLLANYPAKANEVDSWWASYKADYYSWLKSDLKALGVS